MVTIGWTLLVLFVIAMIAPEVLILAFMALCVALDWIVFLFRGKHWME